MPTDMGPYIDMMGEWKDKAREQVDKLKENPLKNVPLGDETIDFMKKWGGVAKDRFQDVKEKGEELYHTVRHHDDLVDEIVEEKAEEAKASEAGKPEGSVEAEGAPEATTETTAQADPEMATAVDSDTSSVEDKVKAAVEDAKIPLEDKK